MFFIIFILKVESMMSKLFKHAPVDACVDQLGKKLMHDVLPPALEVSDNHLVALWCKYDPDYDF